MNKTPTQRSLEYLRDKGYTAEVVEKYNSYSRRYKDLFGFADIIAFKRDCVVLVQTTTSANLAARIKKIKANKLVELWAAPLSLRYIQAHGWSKKGARGKRKTWQVRVEDITYD